MSGISILPLLGFFGHHFGRYRSGGQEGALTPPRDGGPRGPEHVSLPEHLDHRSATFSRAGMRNISSCLQVSYDIVGCPLRHTHFWKMAHNVTFSRLVWFLTNSATMLRTPDLVKPSMLNDFIFQKFQNPRGCYIPIGLSLWKISCKSHLNW